MSSLRKSANINDAIVNLFSGSCPNNYLSKHTTYQENLQKEMEARKSKSSNMLY